MVYFNINLDQSKVYDRAINRETKFIEERVQAGITGRILNGSRDAQEIVDSLRAISLLTERFQVSKKTSACSNKTAVNMQVDTLLNTERQVDRINKVHMQILFPPVGAHCPAITASVLHAVSSLCVAAPNPQDP